VLNEEKVGERGGEMGKNRRRRTVQQIDQKITKKNRIETKC